MIFFGCASDPDDGDGDTAGTVDETTFQQRAPSESCAALFECECTTAHADQSACESSLDDAMMMAAAWAADHELEFHPDCAAAQLAFIEESESECGGADLECEDRCAVWTGSAEQGEPCEALFADPYRVETCAADLTCDSGFCQPICPPRPAEGGDCSDAFTKCQAGLWCDEGVCAPVLGSGESCADAFQGCDPSTYCSNAELVCTPKGAPGDPCPDGGVQCLSGLCDLPGAEVCLPETPAVCSLD